MDGSSVKSKFGRAFQKGLEIQKNVIRFQRKEACIGAHRKKGGARSKKEISSGSSGKANRLGHVFFEGPIEKKLIEKGRVER